MVNQSKVNEPRFLQKWREFGAIYTVKPTKFVKLVTTELKKLYPTAQIYVVSQDDIQPRADGTPALAVHRRAAIEIDGQYRGEVCWGVAERESVPEGVNSIDSLAYHPQGQLEYNLVHIKAPKPGSHILFNRDGKVIDTLNFNPAQGTTIEKTIQEFLRQVSVAPQGGFAYR